MAPLCHAEGPLLITWTIFLSSTPQNHLCWIFTIFGTFFALFWYSSRWFLDCFKNPSIESKDFVVRSLFCNTFMVYLCFYRSVSMFSIYLAKLNLWFKKAFLQWYWSTPTLTFRWSLLEFQRCEVIYLDIKCLFVYDQSYINHASWITQFNSAGLCHCYICVSISSSMISRFLCLFCVYIFIVMLCIVFLNHLHVQFVIHYIQFLNHASIHYFC